MPQELKLTIFEEILVQVVSNFIPFLLASAFLWLIGNAFISLGIAVGLGRVSVNFDPLIRRFLFEKSANEDSDVDPNPSRDSE